MKRVSKWYSRGMHALLACQYWRRQRFRHGLTPPFLAWVALSYSEEEFSRESFVKLFHYIALIGAGARTEEIGLMPTVFTCNVVNAHVWGIRDARNARAMKHRCEVMSRQEKLPGYFYSDGNLSASPTYGPVMLDIMALNYVDSFLAGNYARHDQVFIEPQERDYADRADMFEYIKANKKDAFKVIKEDAIKCREIMMRLGRAIVKTCDVLEEDGREEW